MAGQNAATSAKASLWRGGLEGACDVCRTLQEKESLVGLDS